MAFIAYTFTEEGLIRGIVGEALRQAVLYPLACRSGLTIPDSLAAYPTVLRCWRARVAALQRAGWVPLNPPARTDHKTGATVDATTGAGFRCQYVQNCPPAGTHRVGQGAWGMSCKRARVCPWCWGRTVVFGALRSMQLALRLVPPAPRQRLKLVAFRHIEPDSVPITQYDQHPIPAQLWARDLKRHLWLNYEVLKGQGKVFAGRMMSTIVPGTVPGRLTVYRSGLFLLPRRHPAKFLDPAERKLGQEVGTIDLGMLAVWAFKYPPGMLFGDIGDTVRVLELTAGRGRRLVADVGLAHNAGLRKILQQIRRV